MYNYDTGPFYRLVIMSAIISVGNLYSSVRAIPPLDEHVVKRLEVALSYKLKNSRFMMKAMYGAKKDGPPEWDGTVKMFWHERGNLFYTGMMSAVTEILTLSGVDYDFEFVRKRPEITLPDLKLIRVEGMEDREYQEVSVEMLFEATRGIMQAATGSGKTFMACDLISKIKTSPFIFYVLSVDLLEQAHGELSNFLNVPIGKVGGGVVDIQDINVVMIQSAIRALHRNDQKFDVNSYKYDDEDQWLEDSQEEREKAAQIVAMIKNAKGIILDECHHASARTVREVLEESKLAYWRYGCSVGPDSYVEMKGGCFGNGFVGPISKAFDISSKFSTPRICHDIEIIDLKNVLARGWQDKSFLWKQCNSIIKHPGKQCLKIKAKGVDLLVTPEHSIYHAKEGNPVQSFTGIKRICSKIKYEPKIECVSASSLLVKNVLMGDDGSNLGNSREVWIDMVEFCLKNMKGVKVSVHCDVKAIDRTALRKIANPSTIYNWRKRGGIPLRLFIKIKNPPPVLYLATEGSTSKIAPKIKLADWAYILGFYLGDGWICNKAGGRIGFSVDLPRVKHIRLRLEEMAGVKWKIYEKKMPGKSVELRGSNIFVSSILRSIFGKIKCYSKFIPGDWILNWNQNQRELLLEGLLDSDRSVSYRSNNRRSYFFTTTSLDLAKGVCSLVRSLGMWGGVSVKKKSMGGGVADGRRIIGRRDSYSVFWSKKDSFRKRSGIQSHFDHRSVKFTEAPIRHISEGATPEWVYDLEMDGHPSFVADGILVHNSATPTRDDGQEPMIKALFGKKIVEISASLLIKLGYLVKPHIFIIKMDDKHGDYASYSSIYKHYVADNKVLNDLVVKLVNFFDANKVSNLTLVKQYSQGEYIKNAHSDLLFIRGDQTKKKRVDALAKLRSGEINGCVATTLADEGLDVRRLSAVLVAGGGKSQTRVYQRIGRALRTFKDEVTGKAKDKAIIILFHHNCRFLDNHGRTIKRLLSKEKEFVVKETTPEKVFGEIQDLLAPSENLLDLFK